MGRRDDGEVFVCQDEDVEPVRSLLAGSLALPPDQVARSMARLGQDAFRVVRSEDGAVLGALGLLRAGQFFGGASVPTGGLVLLGVSPEARGPGVGFTLARKVLEELYAVGVPLSTSFSSTLPFFRDLGYGRAGVQVRYEVSVEALRRLPTRAARTSRRPRELLRGRPLRGRRLAADEPLAVAPATVREHQALFRAYRAGARLATGNLDRTHPALWERVFDDDEGPVLTYRFERGGRVEGYVAFGEGPDGVSVSVRDVCAPTVEAAHAALEVLSGRGAGFATVAWSGAPNDALNRVLQAGQPAVSSVHEWMLRLVDVAEALTARGFPEDVRGTLHLEVDDEVLPWNLGRFTLDVREGQGKVAPGGDGSLRLHVRDLAALYSGFLTPDELRGAGALAGDDASLALAARLFAGPRPWMSDRL